MKFLKNVKRKEFDYDNFCKKIDETLKDFNADIIGVGCMFTMTHVSLKMFVNMF